MDESVKWSAETIDEQVAGRCPGRDSLPVFHVANCSRVRGTLPPLFLKCWEKNRKKERVKKITATLEQLVSHDWFVSSPLYLHMTHSFLTFKRKLNKMWWRISTTVKRILCYICRNCLWKVLLFSVSLSKFVNLLGQFTYSIIGTIE